MLTIEQHIENLTRHIRLVRESCILLGMQLIARGQHELGRILIANGHTHDSSKFHGIEWDFLHAGRDVPPEQLDLAIRQHNRTNMHHPEYWGGVEFMPRIYIAEMCCDWLSRSQEAGNSIHDWVAKEAVARWKIDTSSDRYKWILEYIGILTETHFVKK